MPERERRRERVGAAHYIKEMFDDKGEVDSAPDSRLEIVFVDNSNKYN